MKLKAEILSKNYYDDETMFGIYTARDMDSDTVQSLVGKLPPLLPGEIVEGEVTEESRFNPYTKKSEDQWKVKSTLLPSPPVTPDSIKMFLMSGFAWKVGPAVADAVVRKWGRRTIETLKGIEKDIEGYLKRTGAAPLTSLEPEAALGVFQSLSKSKKTKYLFNDLTSVSGVGPKIAANLMAGWAANRAKHEMLLFLFNCGLSSSMAGKVIKALGSSAPEELRENPYKLLHIIPSVPFSIPDRIARENGMDPRDERRTTAMLLHVMNALISSGGHVCVREGYLLNSACGFSEKTRWPVSKEDLEHTCIKMTETNMLTPQTCRGTRYIYTPESLQAERSIARSLERLSKEKPHRDLTLKFILSSMSAWERKNRIHLDESQKKALVTSLSSSVSILTGGPGTGKTTIMRCARFILESAGLSVEECAPTGKAARNMSEDACTVHRLLRLSPEFPSRGEPVKGDFLIVDESSMMDVFLGAVTLKAITDGSARVIFTGDMDQLPSVGPGTVLRSMVESGKIPVSRLDTVYRTEKGGILDFLAFIRSLSPDAASPLSDYVLSESAASDAEMLHPRTPSSGAALADEVLKTVRGLINAGFDKEDIQVLAPMKKGDAGVASLNSKLQSMLNSNSKDPRLCLETLFFKEKILWAPGDRIMNIENDYNNNVFNGEIGYVKRVNKQEKSLDVVYPELKNKTVNYTRDKLNFLLHAYAITIHKSQGSEYGAAVVVLPDESRHMGERALVYTAISRAKKRCVLLGSQSVINKAITTVRHKGRGTLLAERIAGDEPIENDRMASREIQM